MKSGESDMSELSIGIIDRAGVSMLAALQAQVPPGVRIIECVAAGAQACAELDAAITQDVFPQPGQAPRLKWIHLLSAGFEQVPAAVMQAGQWQLTHGGGPGAVPMAEWSLTMMLYFAHRLPDVLRYQQQRSWYQNRVKDMTASVLRGATVGILGYGATGRETARQAAAMGMKVWATLGRHGKAQPLAYVTPGTGDPEGTIPSRWFKLEELYDVLPELDYVVLGLRASSATRHLINAASLKRFKPSAVLINPARGALVDEAALIAALREGQLAGAALDVFEKEPLPADHPLRDAPNLLISPHCSPESKFYRQEMVNLVLENLRRLAEGKPLLNVIGS